MADLTKDDPGIRIRKNTSSMFNEKLAHRLCLLPLGVRDIDRFDPSRYECLLHVTNPDTKQKRNVKASDFIVREKQEDGSFVAVTSDATTALFPPDTITGDTCLLLSLRPAGNSAPEEIDLTAFPVIETGATHSGFSPVSQCSFENTRDPSPERQDAFFKKWLTEDKKIDASTLIEPDALKLARQEWETMAIQQCFLVNADGEPYSFTFTVESVGIRPVEDIVAEGIRWVLELVSRFADETVPFKELGVTVRPANSVMHGVDILFDKQEHTLGNLLQTMITEEYATDGRLQRGAPITYVGYKVPHPLKKEMLLRLGLHAEDATSLDAVARSVIATGARRALAIFTQLDASWRAPSAAPAAPVAPVAPVARSKKAKKAVR